MACQFQSTYYPNYTRSSDGSYTSSDKCTEPEMTLEGLTDTERNKQTERYKRDQRIYEGSLGPLEMYGTCAKDPSSQDCAHVETLERKANQDSIPELRDGYWQKTGAGSRFTYNTYGTDNAAFERIHLKEGNSDTGYLKVNNPPNMFRGAGRYYDHYTSTAETTELRSRIEGNTHDERKCAMGMDIFCQASRKPLQKTDTTNAKPNHHAFKRTFYNGRGEGELPSTTTQGLESVKTPGQPTSGQTTPYNDARGF